MGAITAPTTQEFKTQLDAGIKEIMGTEAENIFNMPLPQDKSQLSKIIADLSLATADNGKTPLAMVDGNLEKIMEALESLALDPDSQSQEYIEALESLLEINDAEFEATLERYAWVIGERLARAQYLKERSASILKTAKAHESVAKRLQERIKNSMLNRGDKKIETETHVISLRKSTSVQVTAKIDDLDSDFVRVKVTRDADKTAIKKALKAGQEIVGAALIEKQSVQIK